MSPSKQLNGTAIAGVLGLAALAAGVFMQWGPGAALMLVGALVLLLAVVDALLDVLRGGK
jgi:hypothetical protein